MSEEKKSLQEIQIKSDSIPIKFLRGVLDNFRSRPPTKCERIYQHNKLALRLRESIKTNYSITITQCLLQSYFITQRKFKFEIIIKYYETS